MCYITNIRNKQNYMNDVGGYETDKEGLIQVLPSLWY